MIPIVFGHPTRRLFGIFHSPDDGQAPRPAVLLCHPFGHEAIRIHRLYRVLADRLARQGHAVLRFDYFGTGDSPGEDEDGDLDGWRLDVLSAHQELQRRSVAVAIRWLGSRLGGAVAVMAAARLPAQLERLVLWDPVVDGRAYAQLLKLKHVEAMELSYCIPDPAWRRALTEAPDDAPHEAIGFSVSARLGRQLAGLDASSLPLPASLDTRIVIPADDAAVTAWLATQEPACRPQRSTLEHTLVWTSDPQPNDAVVPTEALQRLLSELSE